MDCVLLEYAPFFLKQLEPVLHVLCSKEPDILCVSMLVFVEMQFDSQTITLYSVRLTDSLANHVAAIIPS